MTRASRLKSLVYGLGAFGGGVAIVATVLEKYYNGEILCTPDKTNFQSFSPQLSMFPLLTTNTNTLHLGLGPFCLTYYPLFHNEWAP